MEKQLMGYSIKEIDALLEVLRKENEDLKRRDSQMEAELSRMKEEIERSGASEPFGDDESSENEELIDNLKTENEDLKQRILQMESELLRVESNNDASDGENFSQSGALLETLRAENDDLKQQISRMEGELSHMKEEMDSREATAAETAAEESFQQSEALVDTLRMENDGLKQQMSAMEGELTRLRNEIGDSTAVPEETPTEEASSHNDALLDALKAKNDDLRRRISQIERDLSSQSEESEEQTDSAEENEVCDAEANEVTEAVEKLCNAEEKTETSDVAEETEVCDAAEETETGDVTEETEEAVACDVAEEAANTEELNKDVIVPTINYGSSAVQTNNGGAYMNPKINELKAEKERNLQKIAEITAQNEEIDAQITELENTDIIGIVRENGITPEQLDKLIMSYLNDKH